MITEAGQLTTITTVVPALMFKQIKKQRYSALRLAMAMMLLGQAFSVGAEDWSQLQQRPAMKSALAVSSLLTDIAQVEKRLVVVGERGHILYSTDQGDQWDQAEVPVQVLLTAVSFADPSNGWAVGHEGVILNTADGGKNWQLQFANPYRELTDEQLDQLSEVEYAKLPQAGSPLLDIWFKDSKTGFAVGAYGMFYCTDNGGKDWQDCSDRIDNQDGWHLNAFIGQPGQPFYIAGERGTLFRSLDQGLTWESLASPYNGSFFGGLVTTNPAEVYLFGLQGKLFYSSDQGDNFSPVTLDTKDSLMAGITLGQKAIFVGNSGVLAAGDIQHNDFSVRIRDDRKAILSLANLGQGQLLLVGQGGVSKDTVTAKP